MIGEWVSVVMKSRDKSVHLDIKRDGSIVVTSSSGTKQTLFYSRENAQTWWKERISQASSDARFKGAADASPSNPFVGKNGEVISISATKTAKKAYLILMFDPDAKTLTEPLSAMFVPRGLEGVWKSKLAKESAERAKQRESKPFPWTVRPRIRLKQEWWYPTLTDGKYPRSIVCLPTSKGFAFAASVGNSILVLDGKGHRLRNLPFSFEHLITVVGSSGASYVVGFDPWGEELTAFDLSGKVLWNYSAHESGIDWASPVSLGPGKGDGVAISYNGGGGVSLVSGKGKKLWTKPLEGNGWFVTQLRADGNPSKIAAIDNDVVRVFDVAGHELYQVQNGTEAGVVAGARLSKTGHDQLLTLGTTEVSGGNLAAFDGEHRIWKVSALCQYLNLDPALQSGPTSFGTTVVFGDVAGYFSFFSPIGKPLLRWRCPEKEALGFCLQPLPGAKTRLVVFTHKSITGYSILSN